MNREMKRVVGGLLLFIVTGIMLASALVIGACDYFGHRLIAWVES